MRIGARRDRRFFRAELQKLFDSPEIQVRTQNRKEAQLNAQLNPAELISIVDAAKNTPYSAEYLSLLARRGLIDAIKIGRNWATTRAIVCAYTERHKHLVQRLHETPRPASNDPGTAAPAVSASSPPTVPPQSSGPDAAANSGDSSGSSGAPSTISAPAPSASPTAAPAQAPADPVATPGS